MLCLLDPKLSLIRATQLRTAPQSCHQSFENNFNKALLVRIIVLKLSRAIERVTAELFGDEESRQGDSRLQIGLALRSFGGLQVRRPVHGREGDWIASMA